MAADVNADLHSPGEIDDHNILQAQILNQLSDVIQPFIVDALDTNAAMILTFQ